MAKRKKKRSISPILIAILIFIIVFLSLRMWTMSRALDESRERLRKLSSSVEGPRPPGVPPGGTGPRGKLSERQRIALMNIVGNPDISRLIPQKPTFGGSWGVWSEGNVSFIDERTALVVYEDGHVLGAMIVRINDPKDIGTWKVLWSGIL